MDFQRITVERRDNVATVILSRAPANVIDIAMMMEMHAALGVLQDDPSVGLLVFRGAGDKGFSTGVDIAEHTPDNVSEMLTTFHHLFKRLWEGPWITASLIHGYCLGGGAEVALFCDFPIAEETAVIGQPEVKVGCFPPVAAAFFPCRIGWSQACDLILTGRNVTGAEAASLGLVYRAVPPGSLDGALADLSARLGTLSPAVLRLARRAMTESFLLPFADALDGAEKIYLRDLTRLADMNEGLQAFMERRKPAWKNR
jgi:cyclohexa-1,5-dienecarbonyl-CoA hydratase